MSEGTFHAEKALVIAMFERDYVARLLVRAGGNMSKAARLADLDRTTLYRLLHKHDLYREKGVAA